MTNLPTLFEDSDYSGLPDTNPGSGRPWRDPATGAIIVGALGTFGVSQSYVDTGLAAVAAASQPLNSNLTAIAALTTTSFGRSLLTQADAAATRATIGAGTSNFDGAFSSLTGRPTTLAGYGITDAQAALGYTPVNKAGDTMTGALSATGFIGGYFVGGLTAVNYGGAGVKLASTADIEFAPSSVDTAADAIIVRASATLLDVRANGGLRVRGLSGAAGAPFSAESGTFSTSVFAGNGSAANPAWAFGNATNSGAWLVSATSGSRAVAISTDGAEAVRFGGSGTSRAATFFANSTTGFTLDPSYADGWVNVNNRTNGASGNIRAGIGLFTGQLTSNTAITTRLRVAPGTPSQPIGFFNYGDIQLIVNQNNAACFSITQDIVATGYFGFASGSTTFVLGSDGAAISFRQNPTAALNAGTERMNLSLATGALTLTGAFYLAPITFATLPSASAQTGARYRITDRGQRECYSDGTNWRFAADDAIVT